MCSRACDVSGKKKKRKKKEKKTRLPISSEIKTFFVVSKFWSVAH